MAFTALYDANVLHPASLRDLLIRLGQTGLFRPRRTEQILDETIESILRRRPDLDAGNLARTRALMCEAVVDCLVTGYEPLIDGLELPDPDDRHVLAAAIRCGAEVIVTLNLKDFPASVLEPFNIEAQTPVVSVLHVVDLAPGLVAAVVALRAELG
ncbi:MAG: PIN domain-containing protein [Acidimicrobiales bacterium]